MIKLVSDLTQGDMLDLQNDRFADPNCDNITWEFEYGQVESTERETPTCIRVDFSNGDSIGFPPDHTVTVAEV